MRAVVLALLAMFAPAAMTGGFNTFSLTPASATAGGEVDLRVDSSDGCFLAESHEIRRDGPHIEVEITQTDQLPCLPSQMTPIFYPLGSFAAGSYEVVVVVCVNAPDPCSVRATLPLLVATSRAMTIPALSGTGTALAALALLLSGLALRRRAS